MEEKTKKLLSLLIVALLNWGLVQGQSKAGQKWLKKGKQSDNFQEKVDFFQRAIQADSSLSEAYYNLGKVLLDKQQSDEAERIFVLGMLNAPENMAENWIAKILIEIASLTRKRREFTKARKLLEQALVATKDSTLLPLIYFDLGSTCLFLSDFKSAANALEAGKAFPASQNLMFDKALAIALSEGKIELWYREAINYFQNKQWQKAIERFEQVINISPQYKETQRLKAEAQQKLNEFYKKVDLEGIYAEGLSFLLQKNYQEAAWSFQRIVDINPDFRDAAQKLNLARQNLNQNSGAKLVEQHLQTGDSAALTNNWVEAIAEYNLFITQHPDCVEVQQKIALARRNLIQEDSQKGDSLLTTDSSDIPVETEAKIETYSVADSTRLFEHYNREGKQALELKKWQTALTYFEEALLISPQNNSLKICVDSLRQLVRQNIETDINQMSYAKVHARRGAWGYILGFLILILTVIFIIRWKKRPKYY